MSDAPGLRAKRRDLMAHQEPAPDAGEDGPVLPMRFGMVAPDEATVRRAVAVAPKPSTPAGWSGWTAGSR